MRGTASQQNFLSATSAWTAAGVLAGAAAMYYGFRAYSTETLSEGTSPPPIVVEKVELPSRNSPSKKEAEKPAAKTELASESEETLQKLKVEDSLKNLRNEEIWNVQNDAAQRMESLRKEAEKLGELEKLDAIFTLTLREFFQVDGELSQNLSEAHHQIDLLRQNTKSLQDSVGILKEVIDRRKLKPETKQIYKDIVDKISQLSSSTVHGLKFSPIDMLKYNEAIISDSGENREIAETHFRASMETIGGLFDGLEKLGLLDPKLEEYIIVLVMVSALSDLGIIGKYAVE